MMRFSNSASAEGASEENLAICATNFCQVDPKMMRYLFPRAPKARGKKFWRFMQRNFCQIDPKMMRFSNSAIADGASEENLGDLCDEFLPNRPENDAVFKFRERRFGASEENLAICATNFCQIDPKMMRFLFPRAPKARAKKTWRFMRRVSAK